MGRRLTALSNDNTNVTYNYDAAGQRISKTAGGVTTEFYYDDRGALVLSSCSNGTEIYFYPDADGSIGSIGYNGNRYYYVRNAQNDIIGITDKTGAFVARYTYDEWGNITSITDGAGNDVSGNPNHIANLNPLRYRSYFYDAETGWYWLNTRYYDPAIGRFINADSVISDANGSIQGYNVFAYCLNNPVNQVDPSGTASYKNSYTVDKNSNGKVAGYNVTTVVNIGWTKLTYKYYITAKGIIKFDFSQNNYWSLLWRGGGKTLAEAMYKQAKAIDKNFLYGRTIGGLNTELQGHWAAYMVTGIENARVADMGALYSGKIGYDSNAWAWESGNIIKIVCRMNIFNIWGHAKNIRDLMRYI